MSKMTKTTFGSIMLPYEEYEKMKKGKVEHIEVFGYDGIIYRYDLVEIESASGRRYKYEGND